MILAITTATPRCSVAIVERDRVLAELDYEDEMKHAERLFPTLDTLFAEAGRTRDQVTRVACDIGPGSFTGVRVGLASAKGIAMGLAVPLVGVGSLEAMCAAALALTPEAAIACALIDAKRGETFLAAYDRAGTEVLAPRHTLTGEAAAQVERGWTFCGRAAVREGTAPIVDHPQCELPSAVWIARLAAQRSEDTVDGLEPVYVRAPDAKPMAPA